MNLVQLAVSLVLGILGATWFGMALLSDDPLLAASPRKRKLLASLWALFFVTELVAHAVRIFGMPRLLWSLSTAGLALGVLGSLMLFRRPGDNSGA